MYGPTLTRGADKCHGTGAGSTGFQIEASIGHGFWGAKYSVTDCLPKDESPREELIA